MRSRISLSPPRAPPDLGVPPGLDLGQGGIRVGLGEVTSSQVIPPHQGSGAGIAIKGDAWVSGWYPAATELNILKKASSSQKRLVSF